MSEVEPSASQPRAKVRAVLPCRIVTSQPELYGGLAALIAGWGLPCRVVDGARALAEAAGEPGLDLLALDGEEGRAGLRQVLARRHAAGGAVAALVRRGRPRSVSLALALGCDDGIAFPLAEDELRLRLEALAGHALLVRELRLREQVCERWREPGRASPLAGGSAEPGDVLLVGPPSPVQVELADALPLRRVVFVRTPRTAAARIAEDPPLLVVLAASGDPERDRPAVDELVAAARRASVTCLLAAPAEAVSVLRALQLGFADRVAADDSPEELRLRLAFWLRRVQVRRGLLAQRRGALGGPAVDPATGLWGRAMLLDYLNRREAYPGGRERACVVLRLGGLGALAERSGHLAAERLVAACGARLGDRVRAEDLAAHLGEGVFCVVLPPTPASEPEALAARLARELALPIPDGGGELLEVAAVCGRLARPADAPRTLERCVRDSALPLRRAA
jgi:PleD family two-component response regulator